MYNKLQQRASPCTRYQVWLKTTAVAPNDISKKKKKKGSPKKNQSRFTQLAMSKEKELVLVT